MKLKVILLAGILILGMSAQPQAATFNVTNLSELNTALASVCGGATMNEDNTINVAAGSYDFSSAPISCIGLNPDYVLLITGAGQDTTIFDGGSSSNILSIIQGAGSGTGSITVSAITFSNAVASGSGSAALDIVVSASDYTVNVSDVAFLDNSSVTYGGALGILYTGTGNMTVNVSGSTFSGNTISTVSGGGLGIRGLSTASDINITLDGNYFVNNASTGSGFQGGGAALVLSAFNGGEVVIVNNIFAGNTAEDDGGGIYVEASAIDTVTVTNNTFYGNTATENGGGILIGCPNGGTTNIYNNIVYGNGALSEGDDIYVGDGIAGPGDTVNLFNNDYGEFYSECTAASPSCTPAISEGNNISTDPLFVDATISNFNLQVTSPAIDTGIDTAPNMPATDFYGAARPQGTAPDMGAIETNFDITITPDGGSGGFGTVNVGECGSKELTISNSGGSTIAITDIALSTSSVFSINLSGGTNPCGPTSFSLTDSESCTILAEYCPDDDGDDSSTVTITTNSPNTPTITITLTGSGSGGAVPLFLEGSCSLGNAAYTYFAWVYFLALLPLGVLRIRKK